MVGFDWDWIECEYCGKDTEILYGWQGDVWCGDCIKQNTKTNFLRMTGTLEEAPLGWFTGVKYEQPYVYQTPDRRILRGVVQK